MQAESEVLVCRLSGKEYLWQHVSQALNPKAILTVIEGPQGAGKTFWYERLLLEWPSARSLAVSGEMPLPHFVKQITCFYDFQLPLGPKTPAEHARHFASQWKPGRTETLLVDDAHRLHSDVLLFLMHLSLDSRMYGLRVVLLGEHALLERMHSVRPEACYWHEVMLRPMSLHELDPFIHEVYGVQQPLDSLMLRRIHQATGGWPRRTMELIRESWQDLFMAAPASASWVPDEGILEPLQSSVSFWTWRRFMLLFFLVVLMALCALRFLDDESDAAIAEDEVIELDEEAPKSERPSTGPWCAAPKGGVVRLEAMPLQAKPVLAEERAPALISWKQGRYLIQLAEAPRLENEKFRRVRVALDDRMLRVIYLPSEQRYLMVLAPFVGFSQAQKAYQALPESLRSYQPWIRQMTSMPEDAVEYA